MRTVGSLIKEARFKKNYSREKLSEVTHIRASFIGAIESADWENLPNFAVTLGFVKTISHFLNIPENHAVALLRREYPPKFKGSFDVAQNDKIRQKEIGRRIIWGPRMTFAALVLIVVVFVLGYLGFQYKKFNSAPYLVVNDPAQNQVVKTSFVIVDGKTDPDATLTINEQPVVLNGDGSFSIQLSISKSTTLIKIFSTSRSGKITTISRIIKPQF